MLKKMRRGPDALNVRTFTCDQMPELILGHFLGTIPEDIRAEVDDHLASCPRCAIRRHALALAAGVHKGRRIAGLTGGGLEDGKV